MRTWLILWLLTGLVAAESWHEVVESAYQRSLAIVKSPGWAGEMVQEDLGVVQATLRELASWGQSQNGVLSSQSLRETSLLLERGRKRLQLSLSTQSGMGLEDWMAQLSAIESSLKEASQSFDGYRQISQVELASSVWGQSWKLEEFTDPHELLRAARGLRLDLQSLTTPWVFPGQSLGYAGGWPGGIELQRLMQAADRFEQACGARYSDVSGTERAYGHLAEAFDRVVALGQLNLSALRSVSRTLERLDRFYASLKSKTPQSD